MLRCLSGSDQKLKAWNEKAEMENVIFNDCITLHLLRNEERSSANENSLKTRDGRNLLRRIQMRSSLESKASGCARHDTPKSDPLVSVEPEKGKERGKHSDQIALNTHSTHVNTLKGHRCS